MEPVFGIDRSRVQLLDQMLLDLDKSFSDAPPGVIELVANVTSSVHCLRNGLKCKFSEHVAQLARDGKPDVAAEALSKLFPGLQFDNLVEILRLIYVGCKDLKSAVEFAERLGVGHRRDAYKALYQEVCFKGHTDKPEILQLQRSMKKMPVGDDSEKILKQVDEDCSKIIDRIVAGVKVKDYMLSKSVTSLDKNLLEGIMGFIVEKVHSGGTEEETLMLINFSQELMPEISNTCSVIKALFSELKKKNLLETEQAMHLWAHTKFVKEKVSSVAEAVREQCMSVFNELDKKKKVFFRFYQGYVENHDGQKLKALHKDNWQMQTIVFDFGNHYYDGDMKKTRSLLLAASHFQSLQYYNSVSYMLIALRYQMDTSKQVYTFEFFEIFSMVKNCLNSAGNNQLSKFTFEKLQARAPSCLRLLLWPEPAGAKFRLVNKFFNSPLLYSNSKAFCWLPSDQKEDQLWSAQVDLKTSLVTIIHPKGGKLSPEVSGESLSVAQKDSKWKVKAHDEHHLKIFIQNDEFLTVNLPCLDAKMRSVCLRSEDNTDMQIWRIEPCRKAEL